ncbi:MAG: GtrA family protein [Clostridiales bacterium]|nr:GtrA family protein [Clostridiales bacterium]
MKNLYNKFLNKEFLRFLMVGILNTLVGAFVMFALYNLADCSYWFSSAINYLVGGTVSYFLNRYFTFKTSYEGVFQILRFALTVLISYLIAYSLAKPLVLFILSESSQKVSENIAMGVGMVLYTLINYFGQKFFAFKKKEDSKQL